MGRRIRLKSGDIYRFDLDEARYGLGQVIEPGGVFYTTVLREPVPHDFELSVVDVRDILLCGWTMDGLLYHGEWHVIGNLPVPEELVPRPCSKTGYDGEPWIADFAGELLRAATPSQWEQLDYRTSRAPLLFQDAFKAHHGLAEPTPDYVKMSIDHARAQSALCAA